MVIDQRSPATTVQRPASTEATIMRAVIGRKTSASWKPEDPTTTTRYSAVKKKMANVEKYVNIATMFDVLNCGMRRYRRSSNGFAAWRSRQTNAAAPATHAQSSAIVTADPKPADSA